MPRYIDADELRGLIDDKLDGDCKSCTDTACHSCFDEWVQGLSTEDFPEVKHGKWLGGADIDGNGDYAFCSECTEIYEIGDADLPTFAQFYKYCPNCGAKMIKENDK